MVEQFACDTQKEIEEERPFTSSSFSLKQITDRSVRNTERTLPFSPRKKVEITGIKDSCGKNKSRQNEERIESGGKRVTQEFFKNSRYNLHIPGRRDTVYVGKDHGKRQYKQERYLLWKIRGSLGIINAS